jgi:hypothetical protein
MGHVLFTSFVFNRRRESMAFIKNNPYIDPKSGRAYYPIAYLRGNAMSNKAIEASVKEHKYSDSFFRSKIFDERLLTVYASVYGY